jgi:transcriptional repressor NrdR
MKCPFCGYMDSKVIDSRLIEDGSSTRRRRKCDSCSGKVYDLREIQHNSSYGRQKKQQKRTF